MKIKTKELTGRLLDWAMAHLDPQCDGLEWRPLVGDDGVLVGYGSSEGTEHVCAFITDRPYLQAVGLSLKLGLGPSGIRNHYSPSTQWKAAGRLFDEHDVWLSSEKVEGKIVHYASAGSHAGHHIQAGDTKLIAGCRAIVATVLGEQVDIPHLLLPQQ